jgi:hypothetical protein
MEKTCAAAYVSTFRQAAIIQKPIIQITNIRAIPCGLPQISRSLARGNFDKPAMMLAKI